MENRKKKLLLAAGIVLAVVVFAGIYVLYQRLSSTYDPREIITKGETAGTGEETAETDAAQTEKSNTYQAPDFSVYDENGGEVKLSDYQGKPVVLNFWATWCRYCKREMPYFEKMYQEYPQVQFLMVNATEGDTLSEAQRLIEENGYTFPVFYDNDGSAMTAYRAYSLPQTFFIDREGNLVTYAIGALQETDLRRGIERIL